jgi:acetoin utilization protein AcuB
LKNSSQQISQIRNSNDLVVINWKDTIGLAYDVMTANLSRHLPVVDDGGSIVGMISDRDAKKAMIFDQADWLSAKTPQPEFDPNALVRDYMSWPVVTVGENSSIKEAAQVMLDRKISALVVLKGDTAVGIITTDDLLQAITHADEKSTSDFQNSIASMLYRSPLGELAQTLANAGI